jgi:tetratricopeptide (TPR) repeat protein
MAFLARSRSSEKISAPAPAPVSKWRPRAALFAIALAAYGNSFVLGLAQDSTVIVAKDARLQAVTADNLKLILTKNYWWPLAGDGLYRPVTTLSLLFNYSVLGNGPNAGGYHVVNFLLHAINVWLLYELALLIFRRAGPAFFAAALWAVHPICTEAVTSIVGRADLLSAMSVLGGLLLYVRSRSRWTPVALFAIATAGVFAKENAAVLLGLMLLWDLSFGEGTAGAMRHWRSFAAVAASLAVLALVRHAVLDSLPPYDPVYVDNPLRGGSFLAARWTALKVVGLDLWLVLIPLALSCDRAFDQIPLATVSDPWAWAALLTVAAILALVFARYRRDRLAFWAAGFFGTALLPTSNLIILIGSAIAERFLYLPSVAFAVVAAAFLYRLKSERYARAVLIALVALYAVRTIARNPAWNDNLSLSSTDVTTAPRSFRLHDMLAKALWEKDPNGNIDRVIREQEEAWSILAPLPPSRSTSFTPTFLGVYYTTKADLVSSPERQAWYEKSLSMLLKAREISQALEEKYDALQRAHGAVTARASNPQLYLHLANAYMNLGKYREAAETMRYAQGLNPRTLEVYDGLSLAYSAMSNFPMAVAAMEEKALVDNFQVETMRAIRDLYQKIPDGACAFVERGGGSQFNFGGCPRVKGDVCTAFSELARAYRDARLPIDGQQVEDAGIQRYGCQAR